MQSYEFWLLALSDGTPKADFDLYLTRISQIATGSAALIGVYFLCIYAQKKLNEENQIKVAGAAQDLITQVFNLRSAINTARRSWRPTFFNGDAAELALRERVMAWNKKAQDEITYWQSHLSEIENCNKNLRTATAFASAIWSNLDAVMKGYQDVVSDWQLAVNERIGSLTDFTVVPNWTLINTFNAILVSHENYVPKLMPTLSETPMTVCRENSQHYWNRLNEEVERVRAVIIAYLPVLPAPRFSRAAKCLELLKRQRLGLRLHITSSDADLKRVV